MLLGRAGKKIQTDEVERRCIATGQTHPRANLVRFVLSPDGTVTPDIAGRLPGRGLWVSANSKSLQLAINKNAFARAAKSQARIPENLTGLVEELLVKRIIELLSLARKGGYTICGFEKTKSALMSEGVAVLLQADDGSVPQMRKLRPPRGENTHISSLKAAELGLAFGRGHVIHAALARGGLTDKIRLEAARLSGIRGEHAIIEAHTAGQSGGERLNDE